MAEQVEALNDMAASGRLADGRADPAERPGGKDAALAPAKPRRILIFRLGSLGDTVVALPCFHKLAKSFPDAEKVVLTNVPVSSKAASIELILGGSGLIDSIIAYPIRLRSFSEIWRLSKQLRALKADAIIYLTPRMNRWQVLRDMAFFRFSGLKRIIGAPLSNDVQTVTYDAAGLREMECVRLARSLRALGPIDLDDRRNWDLRLTPDEIEAGEKALEPFAGAPFVAINMGGKVVEKHWGDDNWRKLLADLAPTHGGYGLLFLGAGDESAEADAVAAGWPGVVVNACGKLAPRESAAALRRARLFVGHDSGPMHLAAAGGVACVSPFGSLNHPRKWHPWGEGHRIIHRVEGVDRIKVEDMARETRAALPALPPA
ncbi:glycosyltransferase family 9 protein [Methylocella sp.]|uniref:glycosyltransferase family 9 protein n=1 Tax=Methylocella sp. TaxID=1978226 RepID=UPI00378342F6